MNHHLSFLTSLTIVHLFLLCSFISSLFWEDEGFLMSNPLFPPPLLHLKCWCVQAPRCLVPHSAPRCVCVPVALHVHVCLTLEAQLQNALLTPRWTPLMQIKIKTRRGGGQKRRTKLGFFVSVCVCVCTNRVGACSVEKWVCKHECIRWTVEDHHQQTSSIETF